MYPNLKLEIFKRGIRQNHLAREVGINEVVLSKIIHGFRDPSASQRSLLAGYLNVDENWLFERFEGHAITQPTVPPAPQDGKPGEP